MPLTPKAAKELAERMAADAKKKGKGGAPIPRPGGKGGFQPPPMMRPAK